MGLVRCLSDLVSQAHVAYSEVPLRWCTTVAVESTAAGCVTSFDLDITHLAAFTLAGACTSGIGGALWLRHLENRLPSTTRPFVKTLTDLACYSPTIVSTNLLLVPLLCGHGLDASMANVQAHFVELLKLEWLLFGPSNLLLFSRPDLVPPSLRPTCKAMLSFVFSIALCHACS